MPGPAPKPDARHRRAPMANTLKLPAEGRSGETPQWPLSSTEPATWADLWTTPQSVAWERLGWTRAVARYAEVLRVCESADTMTAAMLGEARQLEDRLGLSPMAMLRLRWEVTLDEVAEKRADVPVVATSARRRLKVADDAVAGA